MSPVSVLCMPVINAINMMHFFMQCPPQLWVWIFPNDLLHEGTSCTDTKLLPDTVNTDVNVTVQWTPVASSDCIIISDVSRTRCPMSTLTLSPLSMADTDQYFYVATADSSSQYIHHYQWPGIPRGDSYYYLLIYKWENHFFKMKSDVGMFPINYVCLSVCLSVRPSVRSSVRYSTTRNEASKERYQRPQCYISMDFKMVIFLKLKGYGVKHERKSQYVN